MFEFIRRNILGILFCLVSLLVWIFRWLPESFVRFYNIVFISWDYYPRILVRGSMYTLATVGMVARFLAVILGFVVVGLIYYKRSSLKIKPIFGFMLVLEGVYYGSLFPSVLYLFALADSNSSVFYSTLGVGYFLHIILTVPFVCALAIKIFKSKNLEEVSSWKLVSITFFGYITALWFNSAFRWFAIIFTQGIESLLEFPVSFPAWNAMVFMSLGVVFALLTVVKFYQNKQYLKWGGFALVMVGLHFLNYLLFQGWMNNLESVWLIDIWSFAFLGLGISILKTNKKGNNGKKFTKSLRGRIIKTLRGDE